MPTWNRKTRILFDWMLGGLFRREVISLGQINNPKEEFNRLSKS
jgi:NADH dehydrogenase